MIVKLQTKHYLELLSLKGGCRGSSESTLVKMPHCWKSHATAQIWSHIVGIAFIISTLNDRFYLASRFSSGILPYTFKKKSNHIAARNYFHMYTFIF